ncbi:MULTISPECIES: DUF2512 family protein [Alteribacter]|uniref:DUF2512 family protein n=1 Tax=Alteribacter keqinensis TaxID=2483800 RepID=A0A3M7TTG2_9BACI|nr:MULTISPECIES: DUF2512 family protein [Alteribacter]MBM7095755.1 DUF2512 family protein [Alteribacter salitolerans]RNA67643.1 DUF2512 family protein [Alteribacter keqinensis]
MHYVKTVLLKAVIIAAVLLPILSLGYQYSFLATLLLTGVLTIVGFVAVDLFVLKMSSNWMATISDFGLAFLVVQVIGSFFYGEGMIAIGVSLVAATGIAIGEWFVHAYLNRTLAVN